MSYSEKNVSRSHWFKWKTICFILGLFVIAYGPKDWLESFSGPQGLQDHFDSIGPFISVPIQVVLALTPFQSRLIGTANETDYGF